MVDSSARTGADPWIVHWRPNPAAALRLFCFSYAGGSASIFRTWGHELKANVELVPVQLPGRGTRFHEPAFQQVAPLVDALIHGLWRWMLPPFAFFGHSMGALVSFELARELRRQGLPGPCRLYISGRHAPQLPDPVRLSGLSDEEFIRELRRYGGTPSHILDSAELMALFLPLLRADFTLCESYQHRAQSPLPIPITAFGGMRDETVSEEALVAWREQSSEPFKYYRFPGDHFFIHNNREAFMHTLDQELAEAVEQLQVGRSAPHRAA